MDLELDTEALKKLLRSFHDLIGIRLAIFRPDGNAIFSYPGNSCDFCRRIKSDAHFAARCQKNDNDAIRRALEGDLWIYRCHAGLCEAIIPILYEQKPLACLMIGQVAPMVPPDQAERMLRTRLQGHPDLEGILQAFAAMPQRSEAEVANCAQIMAACAGYIYLNSLVHPQKSSLSVRLRAYIEENYAQPITLPEMADALGVSVTRLCTGIRTERGTTPHGMLLDFRIQKAKQLLSQTALPIGSIAAAVGIEDYNYFSRLFRQTTGKTPTAFRREEKQ